KDKFFEVGGDSLKAAALIAQIDRAFNHHLPATAVFQWPTIEQLAEVLRRDKGPQPWSSLVKLQSGGGRRSVFCFSYAGGFNEPEMFPFAALAPLVRQDYSFYGLMARGTDGTSKPYESVEELAAAYIVAIKTAQATGPYFLLGECLSAPVSYEVARQLRASGENVALCLLDAWGAEPLLNRLLGRRLSARVRHDVRHYLSPLLRAWRRRSQRIPQHFWELSRLSGTRRLHYVIGRLWRGGLASFTELRTYAEQFADRKPAIPGQDAPTVTARQFRAYDLAIRRYRRRPYDGIITLIASEEWCALDPTLGWRSDRVEVHKIPGRHNTYLREQVHVIA